MKSQRLQDAHGQQSFVLVFDTGDDVMDELLVWAAEHDVNGASFTGIGAFQSATLGYFDLEQRDYLRIPVDEQVEVVSLVGNIATADGTPKVHAHVVVGKRDGSAHGGHLLDARVRPTLELIVVETAPHLRRRMDPATGLALLALGSGGESA